MFLKPRATGNIAPNTSNILNYQELKLKCYNPFRVLKSVVKASFLGFSF